MKRPGRPPLERDDPTVTFHVRLPSKQYDQTIRQAAAARLSHADWLRQVIGRACRVQTPERLDKKVPKN